MFAANQHPYKPHTKPQKSGYKGQNQLVLISVAGAHAFVEKSS
jgi:hypothetical protein